VVQAGCRSRMLLSRMTSAIEPLASTGRARLHGVLTTPMSTSSWSSGGVADESAARRGGGGLLSDKQKPLRFRVFLECFKLGAAYDGIAGTDLRLAEG
jgi:hypothetical protein